MSHQAAQHEGGREEEGGGEDGAQDVVGVGAAGAVTPVGAVAGTGVAGSRGSVGSVGSVGGHGWAFVVGDDAWVCLVMLGDGLTCDRAGRTGLGDGGGGGGGRCMGTTWGAETWEWARSRAA